MLRKIQLVIILHLLLLSCRYTTTDKVNKLTQATALHTLVDKYSHTEEGWSKIYALYHRQKFTDVPSRLIYYNYASTYFNKRLEHQKGILYADSLLKIVNRPEYENTFFKERATANISKAYSLYFLKRYKECYYYYYNGSQEAAKINDSTLNVALNQHMCMFLFEEGYYSKAIHYYKQLLVDTTGINKTFDRLINNMGMQDNIGISFLKNKQSDSAEIYFQAAIRSVRSAAQISPQQKVQYQSALGTIYGNLAQVYALRQRYDTAEALYKQSIAINRQPGFANEDALLTQRHLADLYYEEKNLPLLYATLQEMAKGLDTIPNKKTEMRWTSLMNRYYIQTKQPAKALPYMEAYMHLLDSARATDKAIKSGADIFDQMSSLQTKYSMNLLKKDNQMNRTYLVVAVILFAGVLLLAALTFSFFKKEHKNVSALTSLNNEINRKQVLLQSTLAQLEKENREKQHILHVVAHDLRNPIGAIKALAAMTEDDYEDEEAVRENLELIKNACAESSELISGILQIAENEEVRYNCTPVNVNAFLSGILPLLRMRAADKKQQIRLNNSSEQGYISADAEKINRVISNIVTNAIKFSPSGSLIEIASHTGEDHILILIKDNGIGIPEKYRNSIFDPFTEAKRSGTDGEKTFGLGLSITKGIVEKHGGAIWFESEEGRGTTFFIRLPRLAGPVMSSADAMTIQEESEKR